MLSRLLHIEFADAFYHVTSRGDRRDDDYHDDADCADWLTVLAQVCKSFNWSVQAHCMLLHDEQHYHLLVKMAEVKVPAGVRQLNGVYTQQTDHYESQI